MKKQMRDENLMKMSELADRTVTDPSVSCVLLCYLLHRLEQPVDTELLYEIAVTGGIINYFTYQDSISTLLSNGSITMEKNDKNEDVYVLRQKGTVCAMRLKTFAAKSYRDQILIAARKALMRKRNRNDVKISYEKAVSGCYLRVLLTDHDMTLLDMTLFAPDADHARELGNKILDNPPQFYNNVMQAAFQNEAPPVDLTDN